MHRHVAEQIIDWHTTAALARPSPLILEFLDDTFRHIDPTSLDVFPNAGRPHIDPLNLSHDAVTTTVL